MLALLVYNLLLLLLSPLLLGYLLFRLSKGKEDSARWGERWGAYPPQLAVDRRTPRVWVHAVSVGEVMAAVPVLRELRRRHPDALIVLSTTTPTGREVAMKQVPPADEVVYYPLDFPFTAARALGSVHPDLVLLMEWEIWPNFLTAAKRRGATVAVLNGRISDKGFRRGKRGGFFVRPGLAAVDRFVMQSEEDARRAALVGADAARVIAVGNTKFDESSAMLTPEKRAALRADLGVPDGVPVVVLGSTRNGTPADGRDEEEILAPALRAVRERHPGLRVVLAPRHLDRADVAAAAFERAGFTVARRSQGGTLTDADVLLLDTFGELARVYAVAEAAFVGGSLVRQGGQSVFQPLAQGVPVLFGPYVNNQRDIAALSQAEGVGSTVADGDALTAELSRLLSLPTNEKATLSAKARALIERNQGVTARSLDAVEAVWKK